MICIELYRDNDSEYIIERVYACHEAKLHTKGLGRMLSASKLDKISPSPGSLSLKGIDKRLLLLSACIMIVQKTIRHPSPGFHGRGTPCGSVDTIPGDVGGSG